MGYGDPEGVEFSVADSGGIETWYAGELGDALVVDGPSARPAIRSGDRRADAVVILRTADGDWTTVGTDQARGIVPQGITVDASAWGPDTCSFSLARDPRTAWPDLEAFTRAEAWVAGQPVWGGRIWGTPSNDRTLSVTGRGWHHHLDDDLITRGYVHSRMSEWQDVRSGFAAATADLSKATAGWSVGAGQGAITMAWPDEAANPAAFTYPAVVLDTGYTGGAKRVVAKITTPTVWTWGAVLKFSASDTLPVVPGVSDTYTLTSLTGGAITSTNYAATLTTARRYVMLWVDQNATGSPAGEQAVRVEAIGVYSATAYESGNVSDLQASEVITDVIGSGVVPLLSSSTASIATTSFDIPDLWPAEPWTARQYFEAVNAYHGYILQVDAEGRVVFRPRPATPSLEVNIGAGAQFNDTSLNSAEELYNKVIVEATGPDGQPLRVTRTATSPVLDRQGFTRASRLSVGAAASQAALETVGDVWLAERSRTQLRGSLTITGKGALRQVDGGAAVHPSEILRHVGERIRFPQLTDPDTDDVGRDGVIGSASYNHDTETVTVAIDADPSRLDVLLHRYGAISAAVR